MAKTYGLNKVQENADGKRLLGGGCKTCPVISCATATYRGSACASQRATLGLGDPMTNADRIRAMTDEELADIICCPKGEMTYSCVLKDCVKCCLDWLKQPAKEEA